MTLTETESEIIPCYVHTGDRNNYQPAVIEDKDEIEGVMSFMRGEAESPIGEP
ncbi:MAG: hypothetical protein IJ386_04165 [Clostridia bacterium]|nr:hypothetical protein [Clostridia bacterium]